MYFEVLNSKNQDNKYVKKFIQSQNAVAYYEMKLNVSLPEKRNYFMEC
jgi:hypothetical protein